MTKRYPTRHAQLRAGWAPRVATGTIQCAEVLCLYADRRIRAGQAWDLAHTEDGADYRGPAHAKCNRSEGARRRQAALGRGAPPTTLLVDNVNQW